MDQSDLGAGTSSRSSRLIHGGLRYLEEGDLPAGLRGAARAPYPARHRPAPRAPACPSCFRSTGATGCPSGSCRPGSGCTTCWPPSAMCGGIASSASAPCCMQEPMVRERGLTGGVPLLRRPVRRCPAGCRHRPLRHAPRRQGRQLHGGREPAPRRRPGPGCPPPGHASRERKPAFTRTSWSTRPGRGATSFAGWRIPTPPPCFGSPRARTSWCGGTGWGTKPPSP